VDDAKVDELHGIITENKDIAGFYVTMNEPLVVSGLQTSGSLSDDIDDSVQRKSCSMIPDDLVERKTWQEWHHKERLLVSLLLCNAEIEDIDYVRIAQPPENGAFPPKQLDLLGIQYFFDRLQRDVTVHLKINGAVDDSHPSLTNDLFDLVTLERGCHGYSPRLFQGILQTQTTSGSTSVRN